MTYTKYCPHCHSSYSAGHGDPLKKLGSPLRVCYRCKKTYIDSDVIEWVISPAYVKLGYCFANNRWWLCLLPSLIIGIATMALWLAILVFVGCFALCCLHVKGQIADEIEDSITRSKNKEYVASLFRAGYPVNNKFADLYGLRP